MKAKTLFSILLLGFVVVSVAFALRKGGPASPTSQQQTVGTNVAGVTATPVGLNAKLAESQFSAVYFHAPHRCPTCRKIESFAHEALTPDFAAGKLKWQTADYTSAVNA